MKRALSLSCVLVLVACGPKAPVGGTGGGAAGGSGGSGGGAAGGGVAGGGSAGGGVGGSGGGTALPSAPRLRAVDPLDPATVTAGSTAFELKVHGGDFVPASVVRWNGADRTTTFVSAMELRTQVSPGDVADAGTIAVTVFTPAPGGGESAAASFVVQNPLPALASPTPLSPLSAEAGSGAFTLTVQGSGFVGASLVRWNGSPRTTTFVSPTQLSASITASDVLAAGSANVTVFNPAPGGGETAPHPFRVRERRGAFLRVSLSETNQQGDDTSLSPALSASGRWVAFASDATNLVMSDIFGVADVFLRDTCLGAAACAPSTIRVSVSPTGTDGLSHSNFPAITPDGRFVTFTSSASNLVAGDNNNSLDVFLRDTCIGVGPGCMPITYRVSVDNNGLEGNDSSDLSSLSADGRFVVFRSMASNLVAGDTQGARDVFVRDTCIGAIMLCVPQTVRVSVSTAGVAGNYYSADERPVISANGRYVAFSSLASTLLTTPDNNARSDVFLRDTCFNGPGGCAPSTIRVSVTDTGQEASNASLAPGISGTGRFVVFQSPADSLVSGDTNGFADIFVRDTCLGAAAGCTPGTTRVSLTTTGAEANGHNGEPVISADARFIGWTTFAANLAGPAMIGGVVRDTCRGAIGCVPATHHVTVATAGGNDPMTFWTPLALSGDGRIVAWVADQAGIVPNDTNNRRDVFLSHTGL